MADILIISPSGNLTGDKSFAGAKASFFEAGTTTPAIVYSDDALTIPHPSPLLAGADGLWPEVFVGGASFKVVVVFSDDSTCYTLDPCPKSSALGAAASSISFSPVTGLPFNNAQDAIEGAYAGMLGLTATASELNQLDGVTLGTAAQLSKSGVQIGFARASTTSPQVITANIPADNSIPQITEGTQVLTLTYTPKEIGSTILVAASFPLVDSSGVGRTVAAAIFNGGTDAVSVSQWQTSVLDYVGAISNLTYSLTTASLTPIVFSVRVGADVGSAFLNMARSNALPAQRYGGSVVAALMVQEIAA